MYMRIGVLEWGLLGYKFCMYDLDVENINGIV